MRCAMRMWLTATAFVFAFFGCGGSGREAADSPDTLRVFVSVLPQAYLVERIGGELVTVNALVQPGQSEETYEVTPRQMDALSRAQVFFRVGMPFENALLPKIARSCPGLRVVDMRDGVPLLADAGCGHDHAHGDHGHAHAHGDWDPHIWMDPMRVKIQVETVASVLTEALPEARESFAANLAALERDLDAAHTQIAAILEPYRGRRIFVYHPAFAYLTDAYGLEQVSVEFEGKEPGPKRVQQLVDAMKAEGARAIFVQPQFSRQTAAAIAQETGAAIVELDPLSKDLVAALTHIAGEFARSFGDATQ